MANRFLNNITINDEYTLPSADGTADQIITTDGAGQLSFVDQSTINAGNAEHVVIYAKNTSGASISKGTPVYITGTVGATDTVEIAPADAGNSAKMPAVGLLDDTLANNAFGYVITGGFMDNITTSPIDGSTPSSNDTVYVKSGGGLTLTKPTGSNLIQNVAKVGKVSGGNSGSLIVSSILRTNDVPNLTTGKIWVGTSTNTAESGVVHLDEGNGRMGIGTTTINAKLDVNGAGNFSGGTVVSGVDTKTNVGAAIAKGTFLQSNDGNYLRQIIGHTTNGNIEIGQAGTGLIGDITLRPGTSGNISFYGSGSEDARFDSNGRLGIGTTSPSAKLQVKGTGGNASGLNLSSSNETFRQYFSSDAVGSSFLMTYDGTGGSDLQIQSDGDIIMANGTGGKVGIGTTNPLVDLQVGDGTDDSKIRALFSDNTYTQIAGYGLDFSRGTSYLRPTATATKNLYIGSDSKAWSTINSYAANNFVWSDGSTELMRLVSSNGRLGIGTTSPSEELHISSGNPGVRLQDSDGTNTFGRVHFTGSTLQYFSRNNTSNGVHAWYGSNGTADTEFMRLKSDGELRLNEYGSGTFTGTAAQRLGVDSSGNVIEIPIGSGAVDGSGSAGQVAFWTDSNTISGENNLYWDSTNDRLGIGTTSPSYNLDVHGATNGIIRAYGPSIGRLSLQNSTRHYSTSVQGSNWLFYDETGGGARMTINSSGNVGIGETNPAQKLHVIGNSEITGDIFLGRYIFHNDDNNTWLGFPLADTISFRTNGSDRMRINSAGNVGIGTTSPASNRKLHVAGNARVDSTFYLGTDESCAFFRYFNSLIITNSASTSITLGGGPGSVNNNVFVGNGYLDVNGYIRGKNYLYLEDASGTLRTTLRSESTYATLDNGTRTFNYIANAHLFYRSSSEIMRIHTNNNVGIGTTSPGEKLEVNGTVKATATTDAYKGYIKQTVVSHAAEKLETANYNFFPYNTTSTSTGAQTYNRMTAAYSGRIKKVYLRHSGASTPTATAVNFKKHTNGTTSSTVYSATVANTASTNMTAYYEFGNNDFTFNAGDLIGLLYQTTDAFGTASKTMGGVAATIIIEYNIT